jgi:hypothetical protein
MMAYQNQTEVDYDDSQGKGVSGENCGAKESCTIIKARRINIEHTWESVEV